MATRIEHFDSRFFGYLQHFSRPLPGILVLQGPAGSGKSTLLQEWMRLLESRSTARPVLHRFYDQDDDQQLVPPFTVRLFTAVTRDTPTQCARRLIDELGASCDARSANDLWREAASFLRNVGIDLLIIDQAERLSLLLCQCLRDYIFDQRACSRLVVGTPALITTLQRDPALTSRVFDWHTIDQFDEAAGGASAPATERQQ